MFCALSYNLDDNLFHTFGAHLHLVSFPTSSEGAVVATKVKTAFRQKFITAGITF